jgi:hypothetical protein
MYYNNICKSLNTLFSTVLNNKCFTGLEFKEFLVTFTIILLLNSVYLHQTILLITTQFLLFTSLIARTWCRVFVMTLFLASTYSINDHLQLTDIIATTMITIRLGNVNTVTVCDL